MLAIFRSLLGGSVSRRNDYMGVFAKSIFVVNDTEHRFIAAGFRAVEGVLD
jgi:hypothetical protein